MPLGKERGEKKRKNEKKNGVKDFSVFSSILDIFFFNEKGERDYRSSGCEAGVPDPDTFWATKGMVLNH